MSKRMKLEHFLIPYIDNTKDATRKLLKLISESSKVAKLIHRNPIQWILTMKSQKKENKDAIPFTISTTRKISRNKHI